MHGTADNNHISRIDDEQNYGYPSCYQVELAHWWSGKYHLSGAKSLPEAMLTYFQSDIEEKNLVKFQSTSQICI